MRHALASHFRGTFAGVCLGGAITVASQKSPSQEFPHCQFIIPATRLLIERGKFDLERWQELPQKDFSCLDKNFTNSYQVILATLPIALFFHDNCSKLRRNLLDLLGIWQVEGVWRDITLAFAYAIAQAISEKLHPHTFTRETISFIGETSSSVPKKLLKLNSLLNQQAGLTRVKTELGTLEEPSTMVAMVFYCCLHTLEDFRLAILHSLQVGNSPSIVALVAALSGTENGTLGIPATWQAYLSSPSLPQVQQSQFLQMLTLADGLLEQWSGLYELNSDQTNLAWGGLMVEKNVFSSQTVAAPNIIR